jgi:hypothetical protein
MNTMVEPNRGHFKYSCQGQTLSGVPLTSVMVTECKR